MSRDITLNTNEITHNPEKPSLHRSQRHPDPSVLEDMQEENNRNPERRIEIMEDKSKRSEEGLHRQEGQVDDQVICPETSSGPIEVCYEVDDNVVDENPTCREWDVCEHIGKWEGRSSVHAVVRLQ